MLARNKRAIELLNIERAELKVWLREINLDIKNYDCGKHPSGHLIESLRRRIYALKNLQKNSKSLKQLAEIQKEIKIEIKRNDSRDSYLLMLAKRGD
jgi:hypothetical protein